MFVFFKQKTAYEMRISDWSSDVCSSDLLDVEHGKAPATGRPQHQPAGELAEQRQRRAVAGAIDHRRAQRLPAKSARILSQQLLGLPLAAGVGRQVRLDRKSTSLNSSH